MEKREYLWSRGRAATALGLYPGSKTRRRQGGGLATPPGAERPRSTPGSATPKPFSKRLNRSLECGYPNLVLPLIPKPGAELGNRTPCRANCTKATKL